MTDLADRARAIAEQAKRSLASEWWRIDGKEVFFCPPQTQQEVLARWYPGSGVTGL